MGEIRCIRKGKSGNFIVEVEMESSEITKLKGFLTNVHLFSEDSPDILTRLSQRGIREATKYFLVPKELRKNFNLEGDVHCQRLEFGDNIFFIYCVKKED